MTHQPSQPITETDPPLYIRQYAAQLDEAKKTYREVASALEDQRMLNAVLLDSIVGLEERLVSARAALQEIADPDIALMAETKADIARDWLEKNK